MSLRPEKQIVVFMVTIWSCFEQKYESNCKHNNFLSSLSCNTQTNLNRKLDTGPLPNIISDVSYEGLDGHFVKKHDHKSCIWTVCLQYVFCNVVSTHLSAQISTCSPPKYIYKVSPLKNKCHIKTSKPLKLAIYHFFALYAEHIICIRR